MLPCLTCKQKLVNEKLKCKYAYLENQRITFSKKASQRQNKKKNSVLEKNKFKM